MRPVILITKQTRGCYITALLPWCLLVMPCHLFFFVSTKTNPRGGRGGVLRVSSAGMIKWGQKSKPQSILRPFSKTPKIFRPNIDPNKTPCRISETQKCPEIIVTNTNYAIGIRGRYHESSDCYEYPPKKSRNQKFQAQKNPLIILITIFVRYFEFSSKNR